MREIRKKIYERNSNERGEMKGTGEKGAFERKGLQASIWPAKGVCSGVVGDTGGDIPTFTAPIGILSGPTTPGTVTLAVSAPNTFPNSTVPSVPCACVETGGEVES